MKFVKILPEGKKYVNKRWVFKKKYNKNNNIEKYKERLVARGFKQVKGIDYNLIFSHSLDTEIYTTIIEGDKNYQKRYQKLKKVLYCLKQAG